MEQNVRYHVVFYGDLAEGQELEEVKRRLIVMFRLNPERIESIFSGKPLMIKENIGRNEALKYKTAFEKSGARCRIVPVKGKTGQPRSKTPQASPKAKAAPAQTPTRPGKPRSQTLFFQPDIPSEQLDHAIQSYARTFRQGEEQALLLLDLGDSRAALLLSDRRLYVRRVNAPPRTIKLAGIRSVDSKQNGLFVNKQPLLTLPEPFQEKLQSLVDAINSATKEATLHPVEEEPLAPQTEDEAESPKVNISRIVAALVIVFVLIGVGFQLLGPSKRESASVQSESEAEPKTDDAPSAESSSKEKPSEKNTQTPAELAVSCKKFEYSIEAGQSETVEFAQEYWVSEKELKPEDAANFYELENDELQEYGGNVLSPSPYIITTQMAVWALDGREMYERVRNIDWCQYIDEKKRWNERPPCVPKIHKWKDFELKWQADGYGIIMRIDGVYGMRNVGELSNDEINTKLSPDGGGFPTIRYGVDDPQGGVATLRRSDISVLKQQAFEETMKEVFTLDVVRYNMDVYLQNFPVTISAPGSTDMDGGYVSKFLKFLPSGGEGPELTLEVKIAASGNVKVYGPKMRKECFKR